MLILLPSLVLIVSSIGLLYRRSWGRVGIVVSLVISLVMNFYINHFASSPMSGTAISTAIILLVGILLIWPLYANNQL